MVIQWQSYDYQYYKMSVKLYDMKLPLEFNESLISLWPSWSWQIESVKMTYDKYFESTEIANQISDEMIWAHVKNGFVL